MNQNGAIRYLVDLNLAFQYVMDISGLPEHSMNQNGAIRYLVALNLGGSLFPFVSLSLCGISGCYEHYFVYGKRIDS
jgi:uncharacterized protein YceK